MSKIAPYIKQAFGTSNAHEAASFLASAINRMKGWDKSQITKEVEAALKGVNFTRTAEAPKTKTETRTIYKDTPETERRLASYIRQIEDIKREIEALKANRADPAEVKRLNARIETLTKEAAARERQHLEELAIVRAATQQESAETVQLRQQVEELNDRINRLKFALSEMATGNDGETELRQEAERRLASAIADLKRTQEEKRSTREELSLALIRLKATEDTLEEAANLVDELTAKGKDLQFQLNQQRATHKDELDDANRKRIAAGRRADDNERQHNHTRARLKFEEQNSANLTRENERLRQTVKELEAAAEKHEADARHNYYECESLTAALHKANQTIAEMMEKQRRFLGTFKRTPSYIGIGAACLTLTLAQADDGVISAARVAAAIVTGTVAYLVSSAIFKE